MSPQKLSQCDNFVYLSPYRLDVAKTRLIVDMGLQNLQAKGGRIVKSIVPSPETRYLSCSGTRYHGHMAPTFGRKFLTCFYCNKKSGIKYDGLIQQWECGNCESMNFLDEVDFDPLELFPGPTTWQVLILSFRMAKSQILQSRLKMQLL